MENLTADTCTELETDSTASDSPSAAIVSVYNSWSTTSDSISVYENDDTLLLDDWSVSLPERELIDTEGLLKEIKKRCLKEDIHYIPSIRRRRRPVCTFRNFFGSRNYNDSVVAWHPPIQSQPPLMVFELPFSSELDLGFEEKDALFPLISSNAKLNQEPELKKPKTTMFEAAAASVTSLVIPRDGEHVKEEVIPLEESILHQYHRRRS